MVSLCLICDSKAVISQGGASAIATIIGAFEGFLHGVSEACGQDAYIDPETHTVDIPELMAKGVANAIASYEGSLAFSRDLQKYQFGGYEHLCLRCGARFD